MKNFICFPKEFFSKWFYRYEECSFDRPAKLFLLNYRKWSEKKSTKNAKTFQKICFKKLPRRSRKQLESHVDLFRTASRNNSARNSRKRSICRFCKRLAPESLHWNWESSFDNSATFFCENWSKKLLSVQKWRKIEIKLFFVKMLPWTRRIQFQHPRR